MGFRIKVNPVISPDELYRFYIDNNICEKGYAKEIASKPLKHSSIIVAAYDNDKLIGIANAMFNGIEAVVTEFCLAVDIQGEGTKLKNGSMMEKDNQSVGKMIGDVLISELHKMGAYFISATVYEELEKSFYTDIGFKKNHGHINYVIDTRPYVK